MRRESSSDALRQLGPKAAVLCEITRSGGQVQGHSRSPILVPIKSPYETSHITE